MLKCVHRQNVSFLFERHLIFLRLDFMFHYFRNLFLRSSFKYFSVFFIIIFLCCILGIASRPHSFLASFWPANSILLGILIRYPASRNLFSIVGAITGFVLADLVFKTKIFEIVILTIANFCYIAVTFGLYKVCIPRLQSVQKGYFYLFLFIFCAVGSFTGAVFASIFVPLTSTVFMHGPFWIELGGWFTAEMQNALLLLPILINLPSHSEAKKYLTFFKQVKPAHLMPFLSVVFALIICFYDNGPGSILYPIAALIWCALTYQHFSVALITSLSATCLLYHLTYNYILLYPEAYLSNSISIRLGMIMMVIAPLTASNINIIRTRLIKELEHLASHDELTSSLNRRYFYQNARALLEKAWTKNMPAAFLMLDIDHFKEVNDCYGHAIGDQALQLCSNTIQNCLRTNDLLGRLGGEEFAILLLGMNQEQTFQLAENIREKVSQQPIYLTDNHAIFIKVSIGVSFFDSGRTNSIEQLLKEADQALYRAKRLGRNNVSSFI